jgi:hypothetical protein
MLWAESTRITTLPSTRLKYNSCITAVAKRLGQTTPIADMYKGGLRRSGALLPTRQAPPISPDHARQLAEHLLVHDRFSHRAYTAIWIAFLTASRWDEVSRLTGDQILLERPDTFIGGPTTGSALALRRIIVSWRDRTKTTQADPFRPDSWTVIQRPDQFPAPVLRTLAEITGNPLEALCPRTTVWLQKAMRSAFPTQDPPYSAHSIKAGALAILAEAWQHGHISPTLLSQVAKHKTQHPISTTTLRYVRDQVTTALALGSQDATILLPW